MSLSSLRASAVLVVLLAGCRNGQDCFQIEVRPNGQAFQRQLTCWHAGGDDGKAIRPVAASQLTALARVYPKHEKLTNATKDVFTGRFTNGKTPADVGNVGAYSHLTSSLGSTSSYVERFGGDDDLAAQLFKRRKSADALADVLAGWMAAELGQDPRFPQLKKFLDEDLRRDLQNLAVYLWAHQATEDSQTPPNGEFLVRAAQYFCERGYFSPQDIPSLLRVLSDGDPRLLLGHIQRFLASKMGIAKDQPIPASLGFLGDLPRLTASLGKYARSTEPLRKRLAAAKPQKQNKAGSKETMPAREDEDSITQLILEPALDMVGFQLNIFGGSVRSLNLRLICAEKPYATNGKWNDKLAAATWDRSLDADRKAPVVCFAFWSTPDVSFQKAHFGKLLLTGEGLAQYAIWRGLLTPTEAKEWDRFIDGLKPGPNLEAAVQTFRFSTDPKVKSTESQEQAASLADAPRSLILDCLRTKAAE
jgi:hypothetical protein